MSQSRAKQLWDLFIEAECGSYEKSAWCDIFLSQVLSELHNDRPIQEILNFGNFSGIGTLIGCEILSDVHQVVNVPGDNEELEPLRSYLLTKGWRGLAVLHAMGDLNLACSSELAKLLLFLYPLCLNKSNCDARNNLFLNIKPSVVQDITLPKTPAKIKHATSHSALSPRVEYNRSLSYSSARSRRAMLRDMATEIGLNFSSDEPDSTACALQTGGGLFKLDPMDFDYFTSVVRSDDEARLDSVLYEPPRRLSRVSRPHPRDLVDAATNTVMESAVSPYEFSMLSVQLLTSLAKAEHTFPICPENSYPTCTQCIKFSLENLCSLQFHSISDLLTPEEAVELKVSWTQLLVMCLEKVMGCPDVTCSVILAGILPMMLRVLEDVINKIYVEAKTEVSSRLEEVAYGLLCGSIGFLHSLLLQGSDPDSLKTFLELVNQMIDSGGGRLLDRTVFTLRERSRRILELLSQLVIAVKRLRQRLSAPAVPKIGNRKQKSLCDSHHHNDVFGSIAATPIPSSKNVCCVNKLTMVFVRLLQNTEKLPTEITNLLLRVMAHCGICCCMPIKEPIKALVKLSKEKHSKTRVLGFTLLEKTIYPQLGAYDIVGYRSTCEHCNQKSSETAWEKLELFRDIVLSNEIRQGTSIICHLIRIAPVLRMPVKEVVLFKIFFPVFLQSKTEYFKTKSEHLEFIILSSLSLFAGILNEPFIQHFIMLQGTGHVLDLIDLPNFSKHCCSVMEKAVTCELNVCLNIPDVSTLYMLQMAAERATDSFLASAGVESIRRRAMGIKRGRNHVVPKLSTELLQYVAVFWRSYACLTLTNATLRSHFSVGSVLDDSQIMFKLALGYFTKTHSSNLEIVEDSESFYHILSRLVESLLTFLLVSSTSGSGVEEGTIEKLAQVLNECDTASVDVKKISEVIIKCSLARPNSSLILDSPKIPIAPVWSNCTEGMPEKELESESTCSGEDDYVTADEGYDADVELKTCQSFGAETSSIESESSTQAEGPGGKTSPVIIYPKLCALIVEFLVRAFANERAMDEKTWQGLEESLIAVLVRLTALCHDNPANCVALCQQSIIMLLLKGFSPCLVDSKSWFVNLRTVVLELVQVLGRNAITSAELQEILHLFKADSPPLPEILKSLISLVNEQGARPDYALKFPVLSPQDFDTTNDRSINRVHRRQGVMSSWSMCSVQILVPGQLGWSPWLTGAALSFWVRIDRGSAQVRPIPTNRKISIRPVESTHRASICPSQPSRKISQAESHASAFSTGLSDWGLSVDEEANSALPAVKQVSIKKQLHFFSFGSENLILECWIDLMSCGVNLRLTRVDPIKGYEVISEQTIEGGLISATWHHVAVNIKDYVHNKRTVIELTWIVDGYKEIKTQLPFIGLVMRKPRDMFLLLGHQATDFDTKKSLSIANLFLFRTPLFTKPRALGLIAYGPNWTNLAECRVAKPSPDLHHYLNVDSVKSCVDWNEILSDPVCRHRDLAESLLLVYSAHDPNTVAIYQGNSSVSASSLLFRPSTVDPPAAQLSPVHAVPTILAPLICKKNETIIPASSLLGGSSIFLYLFARVVELNATAAEQADALFLLLRLVQSDANLYSQFISYDYHKLLRKIFQSRFCKPSLDLLKAIFDACCDKPIITDTVNGLAVNTSSTAIIKNSLLLSTLVSIWLDTVGGSSLLQAMFASLQTLVCDEHPYREFNVAELNRTRTMNTLLSFCKGRLVGEKKSTTERDVWVSVVELVTSLMGAPPEVSHVVGVMDTLLLLHPANATYITHLKNSFYLLISAAQNYTNQAVSHDPDALRLIRQATSMSLNKWVQTLKTNSQAKDEYANPVDAGKLSKALTNLQVKNSTVDVCPSPKEEEEEIDSNRYSDDVTLDSGISDTCRENIEQDNNIVKAVDGSQQNLGSFFPSINANFQDKAEFEEQEKCLREMHQQENCDYVLIEGFLLLLRDVLLVLPDNMAHQVLSYVTKFEILLVMANHKNHAVRAGVVQLISSYLKRANDDERNKFMKARGFYHLANQLALYPASQLLAEACLNLITPCVVALDDQTFIAHMEFSHGELASLPPLLALLPRSVHDCILIHHLINTLKTIFCKSAACAKALLDHGLIEVLVKALLASAHISYVSHQITSQDLVVSDLQSFFIIIASQFVGTTGIPNMQVVSDIRLELHYVGRVEQDGCGANAHCVKVVRDTQCRFLEKCLELLLEKVMTLQIESRGQTANFTLGITPDDVLGPRSMTSSRSSASLSNFGSQSGGKEISQNDLKERMLMVMPWCVQFLINEAVVDGERFSLGQTELDFVYRIFPKFLEMMSLTLEKRSYVPWSGARGVLWAVRQPLKSETAELLVWLICPRQAVQTRLFVITSLLACAKTKEIISALLQTHPQIEIKFTVFLWDLMYNSNISGIDLRRCMELKENLQQWGVLLPQAVGNSTDPWGPECNLLLTQMDRQKGAWLKEIESSVIRCVTKYDNLLKALGEDAMLMTRIAVDAQNVERKAQFSEIRLAKSAEVTATVRWRAIVDQLTHEGALWCDKRALPRFWQLDPTEGPHRMRTRLMASHLSFAPKYLKPEFQFKSTTTEQHHPLSYLFERHHETCPSAVVIERLHSNEKIKEMATARVITPAHEVPGELLIGESSLYFVAEDKHLCSTLDAGSTTWPFEDVREIHPRRFQLKERAIELFLRTGRTYLIAFQTCKEKETFVAALRDCDLPNQATIDTLVHFTNQWREKQITNWEYLTQLNKIAGRSFNDLMQYPVFPFVLADFVSPVLNLSSQTSFRNLKKPMAVQNKRNEQHYINNYNDLLAGLSQVSLNREPYHYGSHYSNSGTVLHFLVRLPPFTTMLIKYQDGNFDLPDRTFHNMETTWRLTSCDSVTDVKELIPEFYSLPEFFLNQQGFDLGVRQNSDRVDDVILPPWCGGDARRFILIHRQALESDAVTENLPHWIDLVFGYKQTGKAAVDAINVFHPATYCGFNVENIQDPNERIAWETMVRTYGQTPRQLLRTPHPLVIQSLVSSSSPTIPVLPEVKALKWGNYVGSPIEAAPRIAWKQTSKDHTVTASLLPLSTNDVYALPVATTCLIHYSKEKGLSLVNSTPIRAALVSWGHFDGLLRVKIKKEQPAEPLMFISHLNPVTTCCSVPESGQLWIGHQSGSITVVKFSFRHDRYHVVFVPLPVHLQAHKSAVTAIVMSGAFSIAVTASRDGSLKIWDLNNISYICSIELGEQVVLAAISPTLGDIASIVQTSEPSVSKLNLHSINAKSLGSVTVNDGPITSVCFSSAMEGISVNVVACGLANGIIRLWSTWNLAFVRDILNPAFQFPIISLAYSRDAQHLYAGCADGTVFVWESSGVKYDSHPPKFLNLKTVL